MSGNPHSAQRLSPLPKTNDSPRIAESGSEADPDSANIQTELFPLSKNWKTLCLSYVIWVSYLLHGHWTTQKIGSGWMWASALSLPLTHICAAAFISPLPWILFRRLAPPWKYILSFSLSLIVCELASATLPVIDVWIVAHENPKLNLKNFVQLYISLVGPFLMIVGWLVAARAQSEDLRRASEAEALIAKNRLLQSQIHPHVLFNSLNGLVELIHKDPKGAELAVRHLSDLLRRILLVSERMRLPLKEERSIISDYLALEAIRLGTRLDVSWEWDDELDQIEVPPLLMQPMVENAIKHGIAPSIPGGRIIVRAQRGRGAILLQVWNSGEPYRGKSNSQGIGVKNLCSRLQLHFGVKAGFTVGTQGSGTLASIEIEESLVEYQHGSNEGPSS